MIQTSHDQLIYKRDGVVLFRRSFVIVVWRITSFVYPLLQQHALVYTRCLLQTNDPYMRYIEGFG